MKEKHHKTYKVYNNIKIRIGLGKKEYDELISNKVSYILYNLKNDILHIIYGTKFVNPVDYMTKENYTKHNLILVIPKKSKTAYIELQNKKLFENYNSFIILDKTNNDIKIKLFKGDNNMGKENKKEVKKQEVIEAKETKKGKDKKPTKTKKEKSKT